MSRKVFGTFLLALAIVLVTVLPGAAQSTTKTLATNFTLVNLSSDPAAGAVQYIKPDGTAWRADQNFTLAANGGQQIFRQYTDNDLPAGRGSVVVSADQAVGAVVQVLARGQNPTSSGAYSGMSQGASSFYIPLAARNKGTASGLGNSQIIVQNSGSIDTNAQIKLINANGSVQYTKSSPAVIKPGAAWLYDLPLEGASNVPDNWLGSAVATATTPGGEIVVVSNFFTGDALQTFNAFSSTSPGTKWFVPLFTSRLGNSLSTPITIQNLSGGTIAAGGVTMTCTPSGAGSPFTKSNSAAFDDSASYSFNPVVDMTIPEKFTGSCIVDSPSNVVVFVQMRFISTGEAAAYEAFKPGTDTKLIVPLVAKRLTNGFATAVTIQNLDTANAATVQLAYTPSPECVGCPSSAFDMTIPAGGNLIQNQRTADGVPTLPDKWQGTLVVTSNRPIAGFTQLSFLRSVNPSLPGGDNYMAHDDFTQP